jgi:DNA-binding CsgD family transcriptional regulator
MRRSLMDVVNRIGVAMEQPLGKPDAIATAIESIYDTLLEPGRWDAALANLSQAFDAPMVAIWRYDQNSGHAYDFQSLGFDAVSARRYVEYYSAIDPATPIVLSSPVGCWNADERLLDPSRREQWEYVHDFALPAGVGRVGGVRVYADRAMSMYFGAQRPPGSRAFGDAAASLSSVVVPHLARAARIHLRLSAVTMQCEWSKVALDELSAAVCIVDEHGHVFFANQVARRDLASDAALRIRAGRLSGSSPLVQERLQAALKAAFGSPRTAHGFLTAHSPSDEHVRQAMIIPLPESHEFARTMTAPVAMFLVCHEQAAWDGSRARAVWSSLYGLTTAENAVLEALVRGISLAEHARRQHVAISTVRTHVASLLAKTGVNSQTRLVALAASARLLR